VADVDKPRRRRSLLALAALGGIAVGVAGVYVTGGGAGNAKAAECRDARSAALEPFVGGEVAALLTLDDPVNVADLAFVGPDGQPMTLKDFRGKAVLLNLWATWCVPCREEMPALDNLAGLFEGSDFTVVAVNLDTEPARAEAFYGEIPLPNLPLYSDHRLDIFNALRGRGLAVGMPTTLLVDPEGCALGVMHGPAVWDSPEGEALIAGLIGAGGGA